MSLYSISIRPFGIHAILIEWPNRVEEVILDDILRFSQFLKKDCLKNENWELVPAYNSITLIHRDKPIAFSEFKSKLEYWYSDMKDIPLDPKFLWRLPVCYDLEFGIDFEEVSQKLNRSVDDIIKLHTENTYTLYGIGFLPGFMYLGGLPKELEVPRRPHPRSRVLKGSVGLAGKQTGIYPQDSPGGWNIIGNCSVPMFSPQKEEPCFISLGDRVQFYQIERAEYDLHKIEGEVGIYSVEKIELDA